MTLEWHIHGLSQISFLYLDILWMGYCFPGANFFRHSQTELNTKAQCTEIIQAVHVFGGNTGHNYGTVYSGRVYWPCFTGNSASVNFILVAKFHSV